MSKCVFHCKLYNDLLIFTPKNCIKVFYSKITLNVPLYVSQLFTVYSKETFCYPVFHSQIFTVKITIIVLQWGKTQVGHGILNK